MLFSAGANYIMDFGSWLVGFLPNTVTDPSLAMPTGWLSQFGTYMSFVGNFVDLNALATVVTLIVTYQTVMMLIRILMWIWHIVRP